MATFRFQTLSFPIFALILVAFPALWQRNFLLCDACTGIVLRTDNKVVVPARTMEFGVDIESNILLVPAGTDIETLALNDTKKGFNYKTKYGFVGTNAFRYQWVLDGMNEKGLYYGAFYFAGFAHFEPMSTSEDAQLISSEELGNWILGTHASVAEVMNGVKDLTVVGTYIPQIDTFAPIHYHVVDAAGDSVIIEYTKDGLNMHENTVNVVTNNPTYDWHLMNLNNYGGLHTSEFKPFYIGKQYIKPLSQGTGLAGLPGDSSSVSRFVRAVAYANTVLPMKDEMDGIFTAFHVLNAFDIPKGSIMHRDSSEDLHDDTSIVDYTIWTSAADTKNLVYYFKTFDAQVVEKLDLAKALAKLSKPTEVMMDTSFLIKDRTADVNMPQGNM